jgi:hypothetical protein
MLSCVMLSCVMLSCVMLSCVMLSCVMLSCVMLSCMYRIPSTKTFHHVYKNIFNNITFIFIRLEYIEQFSIDG